MAFAKSTFTGNGTTTEYAIGFNWLSEAHIVVTVSDVAQVLDTDYTVSASTNKVTFTSAPANSSSIVIKRVTPRTEAGRVISFSAGSNLSATDLNNSMLQHLYILQEMLDTQSDFASIDLIDDDTMATASSTSVATSESIKAYTDATTGMGAVVDDTTPQLGGDLDINGNDIVSTSNGDINISPDGTGKVYIDTSLEVDNIIVNGNAIGSTDTNGDVTIQPNGTGQINLNADIILDNALTVNSTTISSNATDADINLAPNGTGTVHVTTDLDVDNINIDGNTISSTDTNGDINITPDGTGGVVLGGTVTMDGVALDASAGSVGQSVRISAGGDFEFYTPATGGIGNVVEDTTPELGGNLDTNSFHILFDDAHGILDDSSNELILFSKAASAVNYFDIGNAATGNDVTITAAGSDANVGIDIQGKGTGDITLGNYVFDADQTVGAGQDNYVLTYDNTGGKVSLEEAAGGGQWVYISKTTASADSTVDFTGLSSTYETYMVVINNIRPATDNQDLYMRTSTDGGSTYDSGASDYMYITTVASSAGGLGVYGDPDYNTILMCSQPRNTSTQHICGQVFIYKPSDTDYTHVSYSLAHAKSTYYEHASGHAKRLSSADVDAIRFYFASGNIAEGDFTLFGLKHS